MQILYPQDAILVPVREYERLYVTAGTGSTAYVQEMASDGGVFGDKVEVTNDSQYFSEYGKDAKYRVFCTSGAVGTLVEQYENLPRDEADGLTEEQIQSIIGTGWGTYVDTQYTAASPLTIAANTPTILPNNALIKIETQKPSDVSTFYDSATQKILGRNGDGLGLSLFLMAVPSAANQSVDAYIDITGGTGTPSNLAELYRQTFPFPKGAGIPRGILFDVSSAYTLNTWEANGGDFILSSPSAFDVYGIIYNFNRTHKAQ